jgi:hypothetical protein
VAAGAGAPAFSCSPAQLSIPATKKKKARMIFPVPKREDKYMDHSSSVGFFGVIWGA